VDPPEPELELELESSPPPAVPGSSSNARPLVRRQAHNSLVAPAALLHVVHTIFPLYAVLIRLTQFALWRRRPLE
jgi:hypothetical protein